MRRSPRTRSRFGRAGGTRPAGRSAPAGGDLGHRGRTAERRRAASSGSAIARKLRCAPRLPGPCWRDPLTEAYGRPLAGAGARAGAPARRRCRGLRACRSCRSTSATAAARAAPCRATSPGLTSSNRRVTAFTSVVDRRRSGGPVEVTYWLYRPGVGWGRVTRRASSADVADLRLDAAARGDAIPGWSRSRPCPAATTTSSRRRRSRPGAGRCRACIPGETSRRRATPTSGRRGAP